MNFCLEKVIGHRGACGYAPENTFASMQVAHQLGTKCVEFDVMLSKDQQPVVIHDFTLDRTTNGTGNVADKDLALLSQLDCGSWHAPEFTGQTIPTLSSLLSHLAPLDLAINIEIKPQAGLEIITTHQVLTILASYWPSSSPLPLISSFSKTVISEVYQSKTPCYLGYNIEDWSSDWEKVVEKYQCSSLHIDHTLLTLERAQQIKKTCPLLLAFTVNAQDKASQLFDMGVDAVFSDYPDKISRTT